MAAHKPDTSQAQANSVVRSRVIMWLVLAVGILLSIIAWQLTLGWMERDARVQFEDTARGVSDTLHARLTAYEDLLRASQGIFLASESVTREEFSRFLDNMFLTSRYPGIFSVSYGVLVNDHNKHAFEAQVRGNPSLRYPAHPVIRIRPAGTRPEYLPLLYLYPFAGREDAYGLDLMADPVRGSSVVRARDSGVPVASGHYPLVSKAGAGQTAASLRLAMYLKNSPTTTLAQRRDAFIGMVNITFAIPELVNLALQGDHNKYLHLRIADFGYAKTTSTDANKPVLLYDNNEHATSNIKEPAFEEMRTLSIGQRLWQLSFTAPQSHFINSVAKTMAWAVLAGGLLCTGLLAGLIRLLSTSERRAIALAATMTRDLRKSEARLAEAQRKTQELIESLPTPIYFKGTDGRYLGVNKAWEEYFGTSRENFIGKTVHDLYPGNRDVADRLYSKDQVLWDNPGRQTYETTIATPDGRQHEAVYYKATYTRTDGKVDGMIGAIIDVTERKRAEQRYQAIFANAAVGITRVDLDGNLTDANQKFFDMLGYAKDEIIGKSIKDITHPEDYGQGAQFRKQMTDNKLKNTSTEKRFIHKSGSIVWARRTISVVQDKTGQAEYLISVVEDITDRKLAEQRQAMEHAITRVLAEAQSLTEASPKIIQTICETMGWYCGTCWECDSETGLVRCREAWGPETPEIREFIAFSLHRTFMPEEGNVRGLVRRTVATGKPVWIADIAKDKGLQRAALVNKIGLHSFFGFPIMLGNEVLGAMEFFHRDIQEPDDMLLLISQSIGSQVGQFIQRKRAEKNLQFTATHDALTRLPNRYLFSQCLLQALGRAERNNTMLCIMFLDIDHFKIINDTLGHEAGDTVLKEVAARLGHCVRKADVLSRRGGDEFVVLFEDLPDGNALETIAKKMLAEVSRPFLLAERPHHISVSIGISIYPVDGDDVDTLLKNADSAMYRAKEQGRNAYRFYSEVLKGRA